jgi:hypothetical protein
LQPILELFVIFLCGTIAHIDEYSNFNHKWAMVPHKKITKSSSIGCKGELQDRAESKGEHFSKFTLDFSTYYGVGGAACL